MRPAGQRKVPLYRPQLATLVDTPPSGPEWLHEIKLDGYRMGCVIHAGKVRLISRRDKDWTASFPEVVEGAAHLRVRDAVLDGEVVVIASDGRTSFQALQNAIARGRGVTYFAFDLLYVDGHDLRDLPLEQRKEALRILIANTPIRYSEHLEVDGATMLEQACKLGAEGIVSKRRDSPYRSIRGSHWLKIKCLQRQELVIGGFTDPEGSREGVGSMLLGYYDGAQLRFAGKVGTGKGFTATFLAKLRRQLEGIEQRACPFTPRPPGWLGKHAHWLQPELVAEVQFSEWTEGGNIRHPSFLGFREDKQPTEIVREVAQPMPPKPLPSKTRTKTSRAVKDKSAAVEGVTITSPERVMFPTLGFTKLDLAQLYADIASWALPHVAHRPLTLVRCEHGASKADALRTQCKFLRHTEGWHRWVPPFVRRLQIPEQKKIGEYLVIESVESLLAIINGDILELHTWNSKAEHVEQPDRLVFDLDPGPDVRWPQLVAAALVVRERLEGVGLQSWVKTTGGKGLHIVVPLEPVAGWDECFAFSRAFAESIAREAPSAYTVSFSKASRGRKVLIDYKRNYRTAISVAAFSARAQPEGTISMPLSWNDLDPEVPVEPYTVRNARQRIASWSADPWEGYWRCHQQLFDGRLRVAGAASARGHHDLPSARRRA